MTTEVLVLSEREKQRLITAFMVGVVAMAGATWLAEVNPKLYAFLMGAFIVFILMRPVDHRPQEVRDAIRDAEREAWVRFRTKGQRAPDAAS